MTCFLRVLVQRIMGVKYSFPANLALSRECVDLISKIFQANPSNRISISGIRSHPWFLKNLPEELIDGGRAAQVLMHASLARSSLGLLKFVEVLLLLAPTVVLVFRIPSKVLQSHGRYFHLLRASACLLS